MTNPIVAPELLSDKWVEESFETLIEEINTGNIAISFVETKWVELSALLTVTSLIIKNANKLLKVDFLFKTAWDIKHKEYLHAFTFLVESKFYIAISECVKAYDNCCRIVFALPGLSQKSEKCKRILNDLEDVFNADAQSDNGKNIVSVGKIRDGTTALVIRLDMIRNLSILGSSIFSVFGYKHDNLRDYFITPIMYFSNEVNNQLNDKETEKIKDKNYDNAINSVRIIVRSSFNALPKELTELLEDILQLWYPELLKNAFEHGGLQVLSCARYGDWATREKTIRSINLRPSVKCYHHRSRYFSDRALKNSKFIDIYVVDTGSGFNSLESVYLKDSQIKEKRKKPSLRVLHRYSLYPYSTRKGNISMERAPVFTTGLGVLSEQNVTSDGVIAIKDKNVLTWFDKSTLGASRSQGREDKSSVASFDLTIVSALLPAPDEEWADDNSIVKISYFDNSYEDFYILTPEKETMIVNYLKYIKPERRKDKYSSQVVNFYEIDKKISLGKIALVDLSDNKHNFQKRIAIDAIKLCLKLKENGLSPILFGIDIPQMKLLQNIIIGEIKLSLDNIENVLKDEKLFCPIISQDFRFFLCGNLSNEREIINNYLFDDKSKMRSNEFVKSWRHGIEGRIPLRVIERGINRDRGQQFLSALKKNHFVSGKIQDIHGNMLDSYYQVKTYLKNPESCEKWSADIHRIIGTSNADAVIVDCPEIKAMVLHVREHYLYRKLKIYRIHDGVVEIKEDINPESNLLLKCFLKN